MNITSPSPRVDSTAARSPARSMAGPLVIRSGVAELGGDDHGDGGLAQPGRAGQQHVVGALPRRSAPVEHQRQLLADPGLADEVVQPLGPQRALDHPVIGVGQRRHQPLSLRRVSQSSSVWDSTVELGLGAPTPRCGACRRRAWRLAPGAGSTRPGWLRRAATWADRARHARLRARRAASARRRRRPPGRAVTVSPSPVAASARSASTAAMAWSASRACQPRLTRPARTCSRQAGAGSAAARHASRPPLGPPCPPRRRAQAAREFEDDPLRALTADAGDLGQRRDVLTEHRAAQRVGGEHGQHGQRQPRPDAAGGLQQARRRPARRRWRSRTG